MTFFLKKKLEKKKNTVLKLTQENRLKKLRRRENNVEGTRQNSSVTSGEGVSYKTTLKREQRLFNKNI